MNRLQASTPFSLILLLALFVWLVLVVAVEKSCGQELPDQPKPQPQRVIDKRFLVLSFTSKVSMATDFYFTHRDLRRGYTERNPFLGRHPSDGKLIGTGILFAAVLDVTTYYLKKHHNRFWALPEAVQSAENARYAWKNAQQSTRTTTCTQYSTGQRVCQ